MRSDTDFIIDTTAELHHLLKTLLGARGRDLDAVINSVRGRVPPELVQSLHTIRQARNALAHRNQTRLDSRERYERLCSHVREQLLWFAAPCGAVVRTRLINKATGKCLDVSPELADEALYQCEVHGGQNQHWLIREAAHGYYVIQSWYSGKCLDVMGFSQVPGGRIVLWPYWHGDNQLWRLEPQSDGAFVLRAKHSGQVLDLEGGTAENGAHVIQWECHGGDNQRWWLSPAIDP